MKLNPDGMKPIYVQIAEWLEAEILAGNIQSDEKMYSQYQLAEMFTINPATAGKGLNLLADEDILYKKRGLGMFVVSDAKERILEKRKSQVLKTMVMELVAEAERLDVSEGELLEMIKTIQKQKREESQ
ncbi:DNA-binding transcriptional regulator YhcF, GntR family [Evansella caseinilytica]|uniref:DNA-binding transcriptional regulator YhcF, GntR family n=1 Tax=Evansella caseinilytica TaxID=1503961 RepID=A0A1H3R0C0_9BACI|nr:GntR family transcriptional regulator [Evansella caseinilytica]SDZ19244.1 DNA-binding transcriptional regulator YhcF, GntR family [Evansella caseinilytica]